MKAPRKASELTADLQLLLEDATEIEGWGCYITRSASGTLMMRFADGKSVYEVRVVKKR